MAGILASYPKKATLFINIKRKETIYKSFTILLAFKEHKKMGDFELPLHRPPPKIVLPSQRRKNREKKINFRR